MKDQIWWLAHMRKAVNSVRRTNLLRHSRRRRRYPSNTAKVRYGTKPGSRSKVAAHLPVVVAHVSAVAHGHAEEHKHRQQQHQRDRNDRDHHEFHVWSKQGTRVRLTLLWR